MYKVPDVTHWIADISNHYQHIMCLTGINAILVNIQFLYPKLDTIIYDMHIENIGMTFIAETWINKKSTCN